MKKFSTLLLSLLMGLNVFAQNQVFKAIPSAEVKNFKVAETQLRQQSSAKADYRNYLENEAFYTTYDLQSNSYLGNRMYQLNDGSVGVVAMMSSDEYGNFSDRGTGYNFYKEGNIDASNDIPQQRIEANATGADLRTGWPSIAPYGAEGEILVNHNGNGLQYYTRAKAGEGVWDGPYAIPNPDGMALAWPRIVTTGTNNNTVHIFANASTVDSNVSYYLRSADLQDWDIQFSPLEMDNLHINCYAADDYVVSANGNNIAVVYNNWEKAHTMLYKSTDNGLTWESRIIWGNPVHGLDWETDEASLFDELYAPAQVSVAIGTDGVAHVALSVGLYSHLELGTGYTLYWGLITDGIAYWNSTYETALRSVYDDDLRHALRMWTPDQDDPESGMLFLDFTNFCAVMPPHTEEWFNYFDSQKQYHGSEGSAGDYLLSFGLSAYPAIAVDPAGNLAIAYSAPDVNRDELYYDEYGNPYYYRSIFVNYKPANVDTWSEVVNILTPTNMYSASAHSQSECTFVSAVSNPKNVNEFWFSCMTDDTPGFHSASSGASQDHITTGTINVFKFTPTEEYEVEDPLPEEPEKPSQSLLFSYEGNYINPTTINITRELNDVMEIQFDLEVTNNTDNPVNIVCEIEDNSGKGSNYVCWGSCYAPGMYNVLNTLDAFSTSMFNGHCMFVDENWNELPKGTVIPMKYTFYDENNPSEKYTFNVNFKYDTPQQQYRNVLIEEFTGRNCPYCPMGHKALDDISNINPGKVFPVNIHAQNSLSPTSYPNLNIDVSTSYFNAFNNIGGIPSVMVNRVGESVHPANNECSNLVSQQLSQLAEVNIDGNVVINPDTRVAEITVELEYTSSSAYNTNYLTIMMLQDNIIGSQSGSSYNPEQIVDGQYRHMHVLRDVITSTWGDAVSPATAGTHIVKTYTYEIPEMIGNPNGVEVDLDNIYFLAFVAETYQGAPTRPILNVDKLENVIDGETPELPHYWNPDPSLYANNMTVITTIEIDGEEQSSLDLELGAFCNGELRGSGKLQYVGSPANRYECFLMVYGNAGDNITFKLYDHATETVSDLKTNQSVTFEVNGAVGDVINPYAINFTSTIVHNQELKSGWNWYSTYVVNEGAEGLANLENAVGTNGIQIKNQSKFVNQAGGNWYGTLTETSVEDMFMIQMSSATNVTLEGYEVNPAEHPITLGTNWKWISYPLSTEMSVEEAFASANPSNGDYVKSQTGFAQYYDGLGWSGTLKTMTPGLGYMYQNVSGSAKTLVYPTVSMSKSVAASSVAASEVELHWNPDVTLYPSNMTVIATVEIEGVEQATDNIEIGAFCGDELRGSGRLQYTGAPADRYLCFLMIRGNAGDVNTLKIYDHSTETELDLETDITITFTPDGAEGDIIAPIVINFTAGEPVQAVANPVEGGTVEGTGSYQVGETATLKAIENDGYVFLNWTEDGEVVSDEMEYSFVVERATNLVANFAPVYWIPDETLHPNNMSLITTIVIDGVEQDNHRLEIGAFCGEELRGHGRLQYIAAPADKHEAFITIYGEDSDSITFKLYDHATASILDLRTDYSLSFSVNGTVGTVIEPNVMNFTSRVAIEATANPAEGGTVTGAGNYHIGDEVSLTATANEKYAFINWTVEGEEVYTENNYIFIVEGARNLVANFAIIATPANLKAEATSISEINLTWDTVENALSYNVYQGAELLANVTETTLTVDGLEPNTEYCFSVTAVRNETESDKSEEACAKTFDLPITTPSNLKAEATSISKINLTWDTVENALSYNVYQGAELLANVTETTLTVDGLEPNTEYCFSVAAVRNETESDKSEEACAKTFGDGIDELSSSINIYPNPVDNELFLATEVRVEEIAIYDVYGRTTTVYGLQTTDFVHSIDVADLEAGVYFVNIKTENGNIVKRFVKK
ncbi:MAG: Omp28-related outer membrane protein [Lentimicrobiaceae bacterium]|nr:Omp28-related outer membrane protein [Lentimicrobiaceae bacterium]